MCAGVSTVLDQQLDGMQVWEVVVMFVYDGCFGGNKWDISCACMGLVCEILHGIVRSSRVSHDTCRLVSTH